MCEWNGRHSELSDAAPTLCKACKVYSASKSSFCFLSRTSSVLGLGAGFLDLAAINLRHEQLTGLGAGLGPRAPQLRQVSVNIGHGLRRLTRLRELLGHDFL